MLFEYFHAVKHEFYARTNLVVFFVAHLRLIACGKILDVLKKYGAVVASVASLKLFAQLLNMLVNLRFALHWVIAVR